MNTNEGQFQNDYMSNRINENNNNNCIKDEMNAFALNSIEYTKLKERENLAKKIAAQKAKKKVIKYGMCRICGDNATGIHYGVAACDGCKVFLLKFN